VASIISDTMTWPESNTLEPSRAYSYRTSPSHRHEDGVRVAVAVKLRNKGTQPWTARNAALIGADQELKPIQTVWQAAPIPAGPDGQGLVVVETELMTREAQGTFTLKLWDESESRIVILGPITFP